jgi:hypothetical protein
VWGCLKRATVQSVQCSLVGKYLKKDWLKIIFQLWPEKNEGKKRARAGRERGSVEGRWRGEGMVPK